MAVSDKSPGVNTVPEEEQHAFVLAAGRELGRSWERLKIIKSNLVYVSDLCRIVFVWGKLL